MSRIESCEVTGAIRELLKRQERLVKVVKINEMTPNVVRVGK